MLRECGEHGYFRGDACPVCGEPGKFLMSDQELDQLGRTMAGVLRHFPERFGLDMDEQGFVSIREFIAALRESNRRYHWLRPHHIIAIIETDPKGRYQVSNDLMRATYGHSLDLELRLPTDNIPDRLYYPATPEEADIILETGLRPSDRKMVHLSKTYEDAMNAGRVRVESPIILKIDAAAAIRAGNVIAQAGRTVYLAHEIPPEFLTRSDEEHDDLEAP
ncbi:MAG TPA: RNA 2'-phosphotransferase [Methanomassiliicoccales archaeon]|jgi:putative RNA 2'-phosphotransferase|nr:RNA 2'-phosphotransferase [Euryarchaeota archaeon]HOE52249.1 RNA 2'-phosphotransferase [Methanomassiliicoccales archaeon]HOO03694.1 RNA 2'-phosphotransferase [Methanomassiliicoccales archaeon]HQM66693.1 RNA 2'-phosphotransferase [Methanomassiliicoccales archaeon]HRU11947.1 RNA 2'-phosphotransferase [Methanomassiliicoccales archaeon]